MGGGREEIGTWPEPLWQSNKTLCSWIFYEMQCWCKKITVKIEKCLGNNQKGLRRMDAWMCLLLKLPLFLCGSENIALCPWPGRRSDNGEATQHRLLSGHIREQEDNVKVVWGQSCDPVFFFLMLRGVNTIAALHFSDGSFARQQMTLQRRNNNGLDSCWGDVNCFEKWLCFFLSSTISFNDKRGFKEISKQFQVQKCVS